MEDLGKLFLGILLVALGVFTIFLSLYYHLIDLFILLGLVLLIMGLYFLIVIVLINSKVNKNKRTRLASSTHNNKPFSNNFFNKSSKINKRGGKKIVDKVKNVSKPKNPNEVLKKPNSQVKNTNKKFKFKPTYKRPMKVTRKPLKKSDLIDVSNVPDISKIPKIDKSKEIFEALASDDFIEPEHNEESSEIPSINVGKPKESGIGLSEIGTDDVREEQEEFGIGLSEIGTDDVREEQEEFGIGLSEIGTDDVREEQEEFGIGLSEININGVDELEESGIGLSEVTNDDNTEKHNKDHKIAGKSQNRSEDNGLVEDSDNAVSFADLKSCVLTPEGVVSFEEVFEQLIANAKTEILLETSSINNLAKNFSSKGSGLDVKIIVQEFDMEDTSAMILIKSLVKQKVHIRVLPFVNTTNLIVDEENALIVFEDEMGEDLEIGAVYDEINDVLEIKDIFKKSWNLATDFDNSLSN